jgi:hypothetical protein
MNWTKGLFRLWILLSGVWIAVFLSISAIKWDEPPPKIESYYPPIFRKLTQNEFLNCMSVLNNIDRCSKQFEYCEEDGEKNFETMRDRLRTVYCTKLIPLPWYRAERIIFAGIAILSPLLVLLFGALARWVVLGFRYNKLSG